MQISQQCRLESAQDLFSGLMSISSPATYPYYKEEPFIMTQCPDIFFVGNQETFGSKVVEGEVDLILMIFIYLVCCMIKNKVRQCYDIHSWNLIGLLKVWL